MYKYGREVDQRGVTLEGAMQLYGLLHSELVGGLTQPLFPELLHLQAYIYVFLLANKTSSANSPMALLCLSAKVYVFCDQ